MTHRAEEWFSKSIATLNQPRTESLRCVYGMIPYARFLQFGDSHATPREQLKAAPTRELKSQLRK